MIVWENIKAQWQPGGHYIVMHRAKVPGGWLVSKDDHMVFLPDAEHTWKTEEAETPQLTPETIARLSGGR